MAKLIIRDPDRSQDTRNWTEPEGYAYKDPETGEPTLKVLKPRIERSPTRTSNQMSKVLRHEIGHLKLHMHKYPREADWNETMDDEIDVILWEYQQNGKIKALRARMGVLTRATVWALHIPTSEAEEYLATKLRERAQELGERGILRKKN